MFERPASGENAVLVQLDFGEGDYEERLSEFRLLVGAVYWFLYLRRRS